MIETLEQLLQDEIRDIYDAEKQLVKALPKMAKAASSTELSEALKEHLEATQGQVQRLEQVFEALGAKAKGKTCAGMKGLIEEGQEAIGAEASDEMKDLAIIGAAQRVEHYEIAAYGTLVAWAKAMGHTDAADLLEETLGEEKAADEKLTALAEAGINQEAADTAHPDEDAEDQTGKKTSGKSRQASRATPQPRR